MNTKLENSASDKDKLTTEVTDTSDSKKSSKSKIKKHVHFISTPSRCFNCDTRLERDALAKFERQEKPENVYSDDDLEVLCAVCAGIDKLKFLASGNTKLTRLAQKYSEEAYIVVKWSDLWKCYERRGLLLTEEAINKAQNEIKTQA